jgi:hypothetical protein
MQSEADVLAGIKNLGYRLKQAFFHYTFPLNVSLSLSIDPGDVSWLY